MGQAKKRGTFEERKAQAIEREHLLQEALPSLPARLQWQVKLNPKHWARVLAPFLIAGGPHAGSGDR